MRSSVGALSIAFSDGSRTHPIVDLCSTRLACACLLASLLLFAQGETAVAQSRKSLQRPSSAGQQALRVKLNENTLIIAASRPGGGYLAMADDLVAAIGASESFRLMPIAGNGGLENLQDLLLLRGVDMAIVPANALAHAKATDALGSDLRERTAYVARLYGEEVHVLVGHDMKSVDDLRGKRVAVPLDDGTAQFTANDTFGRLGVAIESVAMAPAEAIGELRSGAVAAAVLVGGKPLAFVGGLPKDGSLRLLSLPFSVALEEAYSPAVLRAEDYPALIPPGTLVETVAVSAVLMTHTDKGNEESARRVAKFVPALLGATSKLAVSQRHPKWKEVNLGAILSGWSRVEAAEAWLSSALAQQAGVLQDHFEEFLRATKHSGSPDLSPAQRQKLFRDFQNWTRKSVSHTK
jgi:uncharacterized protein